MEKYRGNFIEKMYQIFSPKNIEKYSWQDSHGWLDIDTLVIYDEIKFLNIKSPDNTYFSGIKMSSFCRQMSYYKFFRPKDKSRFGSYKYIYQHKVFKRNTRSSSIYKMKRYYFPKTENKGTVKVGKKTKSIVVAKQLKDNLRKYNFRAKTIKKCSVDECIDKEMTDEELEVCSNKEPLALNSESSDFTSELSNLDDIDFDNEWVNSNGPYFYSNGKLDKKAMNSYPIDPSLDFFEFIDIETPNEVLCHS